MWAQKALYELTAPGMYALCSRYVNDYAETNDIMQEGYLKVFDKIEQFRGKGSFEGWMKRIMINTALYHYKRNKKHYFHQDIEDSNELHIKETENERTDEYDDAIDKADIDNENIDFSVIEKADFAREELIQSLDKLNEEFRIVFNLFVLEDYKHKEIAEMLDIDENTSRSRLSRAKKIIQQELYKLSIERVTK